MNNLDDIIPGLREVREIERQARALAFSGLTHTLLGIEIMPLTPFHRLGLQLIGNAYASGRTEEATAVDAFQFIWFLSETYAKRKERGRLRTFLARRGMMKHFVRLDRRAVHDAIRHYLRTQMQDMPEQTEDDTAPDYSDSIHWAAAEAGFWLNVHGGFTLETYLHTPYLVLQQLHRAWRANHPKQVRNPDGSIAPEYPVFRNTSERMVGLFHRANAAAIAAQLKAQTTRLP